ncbi:SDR family oxidoreductase [Leifsonia shinshuensis]|uniref:SDR family NAD(P)-dependent oxidoreductase n=1 Tax=Leifsonia shinshuensis TaxID=150026 RepID=UPI001F506422|nr:SDR family NAD(P)-dependent oxidoreductase [Leifsonia shinshuensis]MCI0159399.1 SDR family oxidoreductase [Leifsonia shinshuensis]
MDTQNSWSLTGKTALVTGATSGLGRAAAFQLAAQGATVVVHGRNVDRGVQVVEEIELAGGRARFVAADLSDADQALRLAEDAGEVDILINNAGLAWFGPSNQLSAETLGELFAGNVESAYLVTSRLAAGMADRGDGAIVSISSMAANVGLAGGAAYSATKAALSALTRAWAAEFSPRGVRVNAVAPGPVATPGAKGDTVALGETTIMGRPGTDQEIADAIGFLASPAASYITGVTLAVDGGRAAI